MKLYIKTYCIGCLLLKFCGFFFFNFQRLYLLISEVSSVFLYYFLKIEIQFRTGYLL